MKKISEVITSDRVIKNRETINFIDRCRGELGGMPHVMATVRASAALAGNDAVLNVYDQPEEFYKGLRQVPSLQLQIFCMAVLVGLGMDAETVIGDDMKNLIRLAGTITD